MAGSGLEAILGYEFEDGALLEEALTHPSYVLERGEGATFQRLEFLGDAVLSLVIAERLLELFPEEREGVLATNRAMLVEGECLAEIGKKLGLGDFVRLGDAEAESGGREKAGILEDALEGVIGAIYVEGGYEAAKRVILEKMYGDVVQMVEERKLSHNSKGALQEWTQAQGGELPEYRMVSEEGPGHSKHFKVEVRWRGKVLGAGEGSSIKGAEEAAASEALEELKG